MVVEGWGGCIMDLLCSLCILAYTMLEAKLSTEDKRSEWRASIIKLNKAIHVANEIEAKPSDDDYLCLEDLYIVFSLSHAQSRCPWQAE